MNALNRRICEKLVELPELPDVSDMKNGEDIKRFITSMNEFALEALVIKHLAEYAILEEDACTEIVTADIPVNPPAFLGKMHEGIPESIHILEGNNE